MKFWKILIVVVGVGILALASVSLTQAATFRGTGGNNSSIVVNDTTTLNDLHVFGSDVIVNSSVNGDLLVFGQTVLTTGSVQDDELLLGNTITIQSPAGHDLRVGGNTITVSSSVDNDAYIAGNDVTIANGSVIKGDLYVAANTLKIDGTVMGNVHIAADSATINGKVGGIGAKVHSLTIGNGAVIGGNLTYSAPQTATINTGAKITGKTSYTRVTQTNNYTPRFSFDIILMLGEIILLGLLTTLWPKLWSKALESFQNSSFIKFGIGLLLIIVAPIILLLLLITLVGMPIAGLGIITWIVLLAFGSLTGKLFIGSWLEKLFTKKEMYRISWLSAALGVVATGLLNLVPILGPLMNFVITVIGVGAIASLISKERSSS